MLIVQSKHASDKSQGVLYTLASRSAYPVRDAATPWLCALTADTHVIVWSRVVSTAAPRWGRRNRQGRAFRLSISKKVHPCHMR